MQAIAYANEERMKGNKVVLQDLSGIENIDQMTKSLQMSPILSEPERKSKMGKLLTMAMPKGRIFEEAAGRCGRLATSS